MYCTVLYEYGSGLTAMNFLLSGLRDTPPSSLKVMGEGMSNSRTSCMPSTVYVLTYTSAQVCKF